MAPTPTLPVVFTCVDMRLDSARRRRLLLLPGAATALNLRGGEKQTFKLAVAPGTVSRKNKRDVLCRRRHRLRRLIVGSMA